LGVTATNEPKRIACGAPDYVVTRDGLIVGYIEAKDVGKSLAETERTDQMKRYLRSLENLILTDYLEFRWYVSGVTRQTASLARLGPGEKGYPRYLRPGEPEPGTGRPLADGRVYLNPKQYFEGAPSDVWMFHIGGYQVADKWLKDRRERQLSYDDLTHYQRVIVALKETIRLMAEIDAAIPSWPIT
jgi:hypothetical protein